MEGSIVITKTLDLSDLDCPAALLRIKQMLEQMPSGDVLEVVTKDACTEYDIPSWARRTGKELIKMVKEEETLLRFLIMKR